MTISLMITKVNANLGKLVGVSLEEAAILQVL